ncbi:hypothetical protein EVAR_11382_1 [Eumeta japonica]|uniref:Uncharacterized protein n=1 Tax=Eumeta variegata TaxID=151549 RepID=A0A4C1U123_EUMVA|nr:hypothetical protein EVAR_11382_1 [Eumeta japonica]
MGAARLKINGRQRVGTIRNCDTPRLMGQVTASAGAIGSRRYVTNSYQCKFAKDRPGQITGSPHGGAT